MEKILTGILMACLLTLLFFFLVLFVTLVGAFAGWVVGLFFSETILGFLAAFGITGFKMWQIGASLAFIGSFFKGINYNDKS
jgi:hypothetical protein